MCSYTVARGRGPASAKKKTNGKNGAIWASKSGVITDLKINNVKIINEQQNLFGTIFSR